MPIHISNKKVNDIHVGSKKVLSAWVGTDRVYLASTLSMLIKGYTEKSGDSLLSANTPLKFTGENLANIGNNSFLSNGITISIFNGIINTSGTPSSTGWIRIASLELKSGTYYLKDFGTSQNKIKLINANYSQISSGNSSFTLSTDQTIYFAITGNSINESGNLINSMTMLVKGSTAPTVFEPYRETLYNPTEGFSLNGFNNIYDTFNTINGELTKRFGVVDLGTISFSYNANYRRFQTYRPNDMKKSNRDTLMLCPKYEVQLIGNTDEDKVIYLGGDILYIQDHSFTDAQLFQNSLQGVYLVYELATPQTYQKKPKTLPQWVKHVFDSSGRELEATITQ